MKKTTIYTAMVLAAITTACGDQNSGGGGEQALENNAVFAPPASAPFTIALKNPVTMMGLDSMQSFASAESNGNWLFIGGRTVGFHGTSGTGKSFPSQNANTIFTVYDTQAKQTYTAPIPRQYFAQLSSTNMEFYQDGNTLWLAGGYGCTDQSNNPSCYQTYPNLTSVNVSGLVNAIKSNPQPNLAQFINTVNDVRFRVTGGSLNKIGNNFYLVMGQNYDSIYKDGITGIYTEQIRRFNLSLNGTVIAVSNYTTWTDSTFHRRDLNIVEAVRPGGALGINVFGGVFTPNSQQGGPWVNPIRINQDGSGNTTWTPDSFVQNFNLYDSGKILLYDNSTSAMYTSFIGGITNLVLNSAGQPTASSGFMPFSKYVSTIAQWRDGTSTEYPQASPLLPTYMGSSGEVFLNYNAVSLMAGTKSVIDYSKLQAGDNLVGWFFGGITCSAEQSNPVFNPSFASAKIYEIHLMK